MEYARLSPGQLSAVERMRRQYQAEFGSEIALLAFEPGPRGQTR